MLALSLTILKVLSNLVDYRFSINFGQEIWDYSGNNNHGSNHLVASKVKYTDRGVFLSGDDSRIDAPSGLVLPSTVSYLAWLNPTDSEYRLIYRVKDSSNRYHFGRKATTDSVYIYVDYGGTAEAVGPNNSFPSGIWSLGVLSYDGTTFNAYINGILQASLTHSFTTSSTGFLTGVGTYYSSSFTVVHAFVWNYVIMSGNPVYSQYMSNSDSSSCLIPGTCSTCPNAIVDFDLGAGCLPNDMDPSKDSYGNLCDSTSTGCSATTEYYCSSSTVSCGYDRSSNSCFQISVASPYISTTVACTCQTGFTSINNQCCNSDCSTCDMTGFCLTCRASNSHIISGVCHCDNGYYASSSTICTKCNTGCKTCQSSDLCLTCWDVNMSEQSNICKCNNGYYLSTPTTCSTCASGCKTCSSGDLCETCWDINMSKFSNICICNYGYFLSTLTACTACSYGCKICTSVDDCNTCWDDLMTQTSNVCSCPIGYYFSSSNVCLTCNSGCKTCSSSDPCTSCWDIKMNEIEDICVCDYGYYASTSTSCSECNFGCKSCSSSDLCLTCWDTINMIKSSNVCLCKDGYYAVSSINCGSCNTSCKTCDSVNLCLSCWDINMSIISNECICNPGYYLSTPYSCLACSTGCSSCSSLDPCIHCWDGLMIKKLNICECPDGYYRTLKSCSGCNTGCKSCSSADPCLTCWDENMVESGKICSCKYGYYQDTPKSCKSCNAGCKTCSLIDLCTSCWDASMTEKSEICSCPDGYFLDSSNTCKACNSGCKTCSSEDFCQTCWDINMIEISDTCMCSDGYYLRNSVECISCNLNCKSCNSEDACISCWDINMSESSSICTCNSGYYQSSQKTCSPCNSRCLQCNPTNLCTACLDSSMIIINDICECQDGFYFSSFKTCMACGIGCKNCLENIPCLNCFDPNSSIDGMKCTCNNGFFAITPNSCVSCGIGCKKCSSFQECTECIDPLSIISGSACICISGYYLDLSNNCKNCDKGCKVCSSKEVCLTCFDSNMIISEGTCSCPEGFYTIDASKCGSCNTGCKTCSSNNPCLECWDIKMTKVNDICICPDGSDINSNKICENCKPGCKSCFISDPSSQKFNTCSSCLNQNSSVIEGECKCNPGYKTKSYNPLECEYLEPICGQYCKTCDYVNGISKCTQCLATNAIYSEGASCKCKDKFYFDHQLLTCTACDLSCKSCHGPLASDCFECLDPIAFLGISGKCECPSGYFWSYPICIQCHISCETCIDFGLNNCITCSNKNITLETIGMCSCPEKTFIFNTNPLECKECHPSCLECSNKFSYNCLICQDQNSHIDKGRCICNEGFFSDTKCKACHESCKTCEGPTEDDCFTCKDEEIDLAEVPSSCSCKEGYEMIEKAPLKCRSECPMHCIKCEKNCLDCEKVCIECEADFIIMNGTCELIPFELFLSFSHGNMIHLNFSRPLKKTLKKSDVLVVLNNNPIKFEVFKINENEYKISFKDSLFPYVGKTKIIVSFSKEIKDEHSNTLQEFHYELKLEIGQDARDIKEITFVLIKIIYALLVFCLAWLALMKGNTVSVIMTVAQSQFYCYTLLMSIDFPPSLYNFLFALRPLGLFMNTYNSTDMMKTDYSVLENFRIFGFLNSYFLTNTGQLLFAFIIFVSSLVLVSLIILFLEKLKKYKFNDLSVFWTTSMIKFLILAYIDIAIPSVISINNVSNETILDKFNAFCGGLFFSFSILIVLVTSYLLLKKSEFLNDYAIMSNFKYSALVSELNFEKSKFVLLYYPIFSLRRLIIAIVLYTPMPTFQVILQIILSLIHQVILIKFKPFKEKTINSLCIINEIFLVIFLALISVFLSEIEYDTKTTYQYSIITFVSFNILIQLIFVASACYKAYKIMKDNTQSLPRILPEAQIIKTTRSEINPYNCYDDILKKPEMFENQNDIENDDPNKIVHFVSERQSIDEDLSHTVLSEDIHLSGDFFSESQPRKRPKVELIDPDE